MMVHTGQFHCTFVVRFPSSDGWSGYVWLWFWFACFFFILYASVHNYRNAGRFDIDKRNYNNRINGVGSKKTSEDLQRGSVCYSRWTQFSSGAFRTLEADWLTGSLWHAGRLMARCVYYTYTRTHTHTCEDIHTQHPHAGRLAAGFRN